MASVFRVIGKYLLTFWPSLVVLAVILYGTLTPDPLDGEPLPSIPHIDKIIHFLMMGCLNAAILFDIRRQKNICCRRLSFGTILYTGIAVALFGLFDEWLQGQLAIGRPSDHIDAVANILGILASSLLAPPVLRRIFP